MAWQVGQVQDTHDGVSSFAGSGFNIIDAATKRPVATFGYGHHDEAMTARELVAKALENALYVSAHAP
jgi:hypothetical protein